jgi:hypothetical protein
MPFALEMSKKSIEIFPEDSELYLKASTLKGNE